MPIYRFDVEARVCFTIQAASDEEALKKAAEFTINQCEGMDCADFPQGVGDHEDWEYDCRAYVDETKTITADNIANIDGEESEEPCPETTPTQ